MWGVMEERDRYVEVVEASKKAHKEGGDNEDWVKDEL